MAITWKNENIEPISYIEDLLQEVYKDENDYSIQVNEQRINEKINSVLITVNLDERMQK